MPNTARDRTPGFVTLALLVLGLGLGLCGIRSPVSIEFVQNFLLPIFFLAIGMELRAEIRGGHLSSPSALVIPAVAAVVGVIVPAVIYSCVSQSLSLASAIPTATDVTIGVAVISMSRAGLASRVRAKFLALATIDDLIGLIFIAFAFGGHIPPTLVACLIGCLVPHRQRLRILTEKISSYLVVPVFALVAGIEIGGSFGSAISITVFAAVAFRPVGKFLGIGVSGWLLERRLGVRGNAYDWWFIGLLGGIGFTVSTFLAQRIFIAKPALMNAAILATLVATAISACAYLVFTLRLTKPERRAAK